MRALRRHTGITQKLDRLEKAANGQIRKVLPRFRYSSDLTGALLEDLATVVSRDEWRAPLERTADRLRLAAKHIRKAVRMATQAAAKSPIHATIPPFIFEYTPEAQAERNRIAALPPQDGLFGKGGAIESLMKRKGRPVIDVRKVAPDFLKAMLVYAVNCGEEAARLDAIRKARNRHFDQLGPVLNLMRDVQRFTGNPHDSTVAYLLTEAHVIIGKTKQFTPEQIRKYRERYL
jgi:hypothetical protein